eukprot:7384467-Prymnesium_polylepis.1
MACRGWSASRSFPTGSKGHRSCHFVCDRPIQLRLAFAAVGKPLLFEGLPGRTQDVLKACAASAVAVLPKYTQ